MHQHQLLNNITHQNIKVNPKLSVELGNNVASTLIFPTEFNSIQKEFAILLRKHPETEKFYALSLFGFENEENLFLSNKTNSGWQANYVPAMLAKGPFLIGFQDQSKADGNEKEAVIHIDMNNARVGETEGMPLFLEHGGNSSYLEYIANTLHCINDGQHLSEIMFTAFTELGLIEALNIEFELYNGDKYDLQGYYTINEEKLATLDGANLEKLNRAGFLQSAFQIISSLSNLQTLINMKNQTVI